MMIYVSLTGGKWRRLWRKIITINFLNIHLDYASIFFFFFWWQGGRGGGWGGGWLVGQRARIIESLPSKWHHKIGSLLFCLQSVGMPGGVIPRSPPHPTPMGEMNCVIYC